MSTNRQKTHDNLHMVRLDDETERRLKEKAKREGIAPAILCRSAIRDFLRRDALQRQDDPTNLIKFSLGN